MNKILRKIALLGITSIMLSMTINCDILFSRERKTKCCFGRISPLLPVKIVQEHQEFIYQENSGTDSTTAIANATITFTGRGENCCNR